MADGGEGAAPPAGDTHAYFRAIEEAFVALRGAPLLLSPADYQVAATWHREGVPLGLVLNTMQEVFARRQERGGKGKINGLRYCRQAVDAAWAEIRELQGPGRREPDEADPAVASLADRLAALSAALPEDLADRDVWVERIGALAGTAEAVEERLRQLDDDLLAVTSKTLDAPARARLDAEVEAILDGLRDRFPNEELEALRAQLHRQRLRRAVGLPVLTLF
jgi:hypothetical protein